MGGKRAPGRENDAYRDLEAGGTWQQKKWLIELEQRVMMREVCSGQELNHARPLGHVKEFDLSC